MLHLPSVLPQKLSHSFGPTYSSAALREVPHLAFEVEQLPTLANCPFFVIEKIKIELKFKKIKNLD